MKAKMIVKKNILLVLFYVIISSAVQLSRWSLRHLISCRPLSIIFFRHIKKCHRLIVPFHFSESIDWSRSSTRSISDHHHFYSQVLKDSIIINYTQRESINLITIERRTTSTDDHHPQERWEKRKISDINNCNLTCYICVNLSGYFGLWSRSISLANSLESWSRWINHFFSLPLFPSPIFFYLFHRCPSSSSF